MDRPSLGEIFGNTATEERPPLDSIFKESKPSLDSIFKESARPSLESIFTSEKPMFDIKAGVKAGTETAKGILQNIPVVGGFTPEQITKGQKLIGEIIERPVAGLRGVAKEGLGGFKKGLKAPEKYPIGTFAEVYQETFPKMSPVVAGTLGTIADAGYYFGMPEALTRVATAGKVKLLEGVIKNVHSAIYKVDPTKGTIKIPKNTIDAIAKNKDIGTIFDAYLKSKNIKVTKTPGLLEYKPLGKPLLTETGKVPVIAPKTAKTPISAPTAKGGEIDTWDNKLNDMLGKLYKDKAPKLELIDPITDPYSGGVATRFKVGDNEMTLNIIQDHSQIFVEHIAIDKKGTGLGRKIVTALKNIAIKTGQDIVVRDASDGFWNKNGFTNGKWSPPEAVTPKVRFAKGDKASYIWREGETPQEVTITSKEASDLAYGNGKGWKIKLPDGQNIWVSEKQLSKLSPKEGVGEPQEITRGFSEDATLREKYWNDGYGLDVVFENKQDALDRIAEHTAKGIQTRFVQHISSKETGKKPTFEVYAEKGKVDVSGPRTGQDSLTPPPRPPVEASPPAGEPRPGMKGSLKVQMLNPARWDSVREFIEDDWLRVKRLIQRDGANVTETNNPYEAEIRYWGRIGARTEEADNIISNIDKDMLVTSRKLKISDKLLNKEVDRFLISRHAPERNAVHGEKAAGITDVEAFAIRSEIASKPYAKEVERLADQIQELNTKTLDTLLDGEVISKELYDKLREMYKNHIPLNRVMSEEDDIVEVLTKRGFDVKGAGLKRAKGSELEVSDILTNVVANYKAALARAEKNIVDNHTLRLVRDNNYFDGEFEEIRSKAIGKTFDGRILFEQIRDPKILPVMEKGKQVFLKINDPQMAMALRGVNRHKVEGLVRGVKAFTRFYAGLMTRFNPEFVASNKIRDLQEVMVYLASKPEIGVKGMFQAVSKDPQSIKDITDSLRGKDTAGTRLYKQMKMDGGTTGGLGLSTKEQLEIDLNRIRLINRFKPKKAAEIVLRSVDNWNTIFEDSSRLSVYRQALKQGVSRKKAAVFAKEASVNFNKMGTGSPVVNALYMFSNASVQGTVKMLRAMRNPKVMATVLTLLGGAVYLVNEHNDRVDKDWRKKVSKWDRLNGMNIVISTDKGIKYVTIPISWGLKPIKVFFDAIGDISSGFNKNIPDAISKIVAASVEAYNPMGGTDAVSAITPSILDLPVDIARNRSWTGGKIRPDWNNSAPASIQYFDSLRKDAAGQGFIKMTKEWGDRGLEISPADMNYAYEQLVGGTGRFVDKTLNTIIGVSKGEPEVKEIPFASRFYRDIPQEKLREFDSDYREIKKKLQEQDKDRFYLGQEAELAWDGLKKIPIKDRISNFRSIQKTNPRLADKIKDIAKDEKLNLDYTDRLIKKLGVENGERSKYLWDKIKKMPTTKERQLYYDVMLNKHIITEEVVRQIKIRASREK